MYCSVQNAKKICKALVCLHNFAMNINDKNSQNSQFEWLDVENDEERSSENRRHTIGIGEYFKELSRVGPNRAGSVSLGLRNYLKKYFVSPCIGSAQAPWQFQKEFREFNINPPA